MAGVPGEYKGSGESPYTLSPVNPKPNPPNDGGFNANKTSQRQGNVVIILLVVFIVIVVIAAGVGVFIGVSNNENNDEVVDDNQTDAPTTSPTLNPTQNPTVSLTDNPTQNPTANPTENPTETILFELFPGETREGNNFIGVSFLVPVSDSAGNAFVSAANRWSTILAGNENLVDPVSLTDFDICGAAVIDQIVIDHLFILATVEPDDGPGGVLGFAGPCNVANNVFIPIFGQMSFDSEDIDFLDADGSLESVILHEMAHVLGIGTLWTFVGLIQNELPNAVANAALPSPIYLGELGTDAFVDIGGVGALGIEDGFTNGAINGAGPGSVNGHFDEDSVDIELMTFQIKVTEPPLSIVTIQSLADLGFAVDITQADNFFLNSRSLQNTGYEPLAVPHVLSGDAWIYEKFSAVGSNP